MKVKEESEKVGLKLNIQKTRIMASGPITSWQIDGETMETVTDFILLGSKIIVDGDCSHEIKRCLLLGRKAMTNLDSKFKSRDITLPTNVCKIKAMGSPVVMCGCESWTIRKLSAEELMLLSCDGEDSWESLGQQGDQPVHPEWNQPWIFIGRTDAEAETPILWPPDSRADSLEKIWCWERLKAEGKGDNRGLDGWMASPTQWIWVWVNSGRWWRTVKSEELQSMRSQKAGHSLATEQQEINQVSTKWTWEEGSNSYEQEEIRIEHVGEVRNVKGWTVLRSWKCRGGTRVAVTSKCTFEVQRRHSGVCE